MHPVTAEVLHAVAPRFSGAAAQRQAEIIEAIASDFTTILNEYDINTQLRVAHFLAQIIHESAGLRTTEEFASGSAYEGRVDLGNTVPGDGIRYKGRGVLQLTGRANYRHYGQVLGLDLEGQPHMAAEPLVSLRIACVYWRDHRINPLCDADDLEGVTRKVNGGLNGLADRRQYLIKAKQALGASPAVASTADEAPSSPVEPMPNWGSSAPAPKVPTHPVVQAAQSRTVWGIVTAFVTLVCDGVSKAIDWVSGLFGHVPDIKADADQIIQSATSMLDMLHIHSVQIGIAIGVAALTVAIFRHVEKGTVKP